MRSTAAKETPDIALSPFVFLWLSHILIACSLRKTPAGSEISPDRRPNRGLGQPMKTAPTAGLPALRSVLRSNLFRRDILTGEKGEAVSRCGGSNGGVVFCCNGICGGRRGGAETEEG